MPSWTPSLDRDAASRHLGQLVSCRLPPIQNAIKGLNSRYQVYATTSPAPLPAPGLVITPEIRCQSELYLPISEIARCFDRLYCSALTYPPILSSTPFHGALSWADVFAALPPRFQFRANSARLLEALLEDSDLRTEFLFASFLPRRFYGGFIRYPDQREFIAGWLGRREKKEIHCLDAACGTGEGCYGLAQALLSAGYSPEEFRIEGWTLEPLEVWTAAHVSFPHDARRQESFREWVAPIFGQGAQDSLIFRRADLMHSPVSSKRFDLILCNGLLGGPIINQREEIFRVVGNLAALLRKGGLLLAADSFHGGWKKLIPGETLGDVFKTCGLSVQEAGEGICGMKGC